jgi:thymidylate kinase
MFIVFEGIDGSGKTELSVGFCQYLNERWAGKCWKDKDGSTTCYKDFVWTKQPDFTSEEADRLNNKEIFSDPYKREALFFGSHLRNRATIGQSNKVCDRYLWSSLAYAKVFSPEVYPFLKELYSDSSLFIPPDLYIFVDTSIDCCSKRGKSQDKNLLFELWKAYDQTEDLISSPIIRVKSEDIENISQEESAAIALQDLTERFEKHMELTGDGFV